MNKEEIKNRLSEIEDEIETLTALADKENVYQMGLKILVNSAYGALSNKATLFAGHAEYFSGAVTSGARIANISQAQEISEKINILAGVESKEKEFGILNRYDNIAQVDTDSAYFSIEKLLAKKYGNEYYKTMSTEDLIKNSLAFVNKIAYPITREVLDNRYSYAQNAYLPEKLILDHEVISDSFISIAPKMYFCKISWSEGVTLAKHKLKITGLSTVRSNTPKFYRKELKNAMEILINGDIQKVVQYINDVKEETFKQEPSEICINQGVSSIDYQFDETLKKWKKWTGSKFLGAPVNSRASLVHNKYINDRKIEGIKAIEAGDKIGFLYMKEPNITHSNAFAFVNPKVFDYGLKEYIDYNTMFEKGFLTPIKLITDPLKWDLTPKEAMIDEDEW